MKLTKRGEYAFRVLINLGIAHEMGKELVSMTELAEVDRLPLKFAEGVVQELRGAGYIGTRRGKFGGYFLAKPMGEITMGEIARHIDGPLAPIPCASQSAYEPCTCPDEEHCGLRMIMVDVRNAISNVLDRYTVGDVVEVTLRKMRRNQVAVPFSREATSTRAKK